MKKLVIMFMFILVFPVFTSAVYAKDQESTNIEKEIIYNILVDRFNNGDHTNDKNVNTNDPYSYHGGDFKGITDRLDDIKETGYTTISLSPIMKNAPNGYHGYWIEDFKKLNPAFGTMKEFRTLVEEVHKRDMKIILEFVTNYAAKSNQSITSENQDEWVTKTGVDGTIFLDNVLVLNQKNQDVSDYLFDAADFWLDKGIDGFKLHAANKADPSFLKAFIKHMKTKKPSIYLVAGTLLNKDIPKEIKSNRDIDAIENNKLSTLIAETFSKHGNKVADIYQKWEDSQIEKNLVSLDNIYTERFTRKIGENKRSTIDTWKLGITFLYTTPVVPFMYQGTEIPMDGKAYPDNQKLVNFNIGDPDLKDYMDSVAKLRSVYPALAKGDFSFVDSTGDGLSVFKRTYKDQTIYLAFNNAGKTRSISLTDIKPDMQLKAQLGDDTFREQEDGTYKIELNKDAAEIFILEENKGLNMVFISAVLGIFLFFVLAVVYLSKKEKKREAENK